MLLSSFDPIQEGAHDLRIALRLLQVRRMGAVLEQDPLGAGDALVDRLHDGRRGFVATFRHKGVYTYTPAQYATWLSSWSPRWAATMDFCCEDEITLGKPGLVRQRQEATTRMARYFLRQFPSTRWCWVPTVQGWTVEDYRHHATQLRPLIRRMARHYGEASPFRMGIGTLCRRASPTMIHQVVQMVSEILPGYPLHLWGVKLTLLQHSQALPAGVVSIDSAAWNGRFGTGIEANRQSNLSQREYAYTVALPAYLEKVEAALGSSTR